MDRLQAMNTFVAVVDSGGFAGAARKLNLSPPVVTRAVAGWRDREALARPWMAEQREGRTPTSRARHPVSALRAKAT